MCLIFLENYPFSDLNKIDISQFFTKKLEFLILKNPKNVILLSWIDKTWIFVSPF